MRQMRSHSRPHTRFSGRASPSVQGRKQGAADLLRADCRAGGHAPVLLPQAAHHAATRFTQRSRATWSGKRRRLPANAERSSSRRPKKKAGAGGGTLPALEGARVSRLSRVLASAFSASVGLRGGADSQRPCDSATFVTGMEAVAEVARCFKDYNAAPMSNPVNWGSGDGLLKRRLDHGQASVWRSGPVHVLYDFGDRRKVATNRLEETQCDSHALITVMLLITSFASAQHCRKERHRQIQRAFCTAPDPALTPGRNGLVAGMRIERRPSTQA